MLSNIPATKQPRERAHSWAGNLSITSGSWNNKGIMGKRGHDAEGCRNAKKRRPAQAEIGRVGWGSPRPQASREQATGNPRANRDQAATKQKTARKPHASEHASMRAREQANKRSNDQASEQAGKSSLGAHEPPTINSTPLAKRASGHSNLQASTRARKPASKQVANKQGSTRASEPNKHVKEQASKRASRLTSPRCS